MTFRCYMNTQNETFLRTHSRSTPLWTFKHLVIFMTLAALRITLTVIEQRQHSNSLQKIHESIPITHHYIDRECLPLQMHFAITVLYSATFNIPDGQYIYQISAICNRRRLFRLTEVLLSSLRLVTIFFSFWKEITKATKYITSTPFRSFLYSPWFLFAFSGVESVYLIPCR